MAMVASETPDTVTSQEKGLQTKQESERPVTDRAYIRQKDADVPIEPGSEVVRYLMEEGRVVDKVFPGAPVIVL